MGDAEFIDPRCDSMLFRRCFMRRVTRKAMTPAATRARKPSTTMTAIAQPGNLFEFSDWGVPEPLAPVALGVGAPSERDEPEPTPVPTVVVALDADVTVALDDAAAAEDTDAADADDIDATTQSA